MLLHVYCVWEMLTNAKGKRKSLTAVLRNTIDMVNFMLIGFSYGFIVLFKTAQTRRQSMLQFHSPFCNWRHDVILRHHMISSGSDFRSLIFSSRARSRGNRIGPVFPSYHLSICQYMYMYLSPGDCLSAQKDFVFKRIMYYRRWGVFIKVLPSQERPDTKVIFIVAH